MAVISILHMPIMPMLQQQQHIPFIIMQHEHIPPAIMLHKFCIIMAEVLSSQVQIIFIPPAHFSIFIMHWGTMPDMLGEPPIIGPAIGIPIMPPPIPAVPIPIIRSLVIMFMAISFQLIRRPIPAEVLCNCSHDASNAVTKNTIASLPLLYQD